MVNNYRGIVKKNIDKSKQHTIPLIKALCFKFPNEFSKIDENRIYDNQNLPISMATDFDMYGKTDAYAITKTNGIITFQLKDSYYIRNGKYIGENFTIRFPTETSVFLNRNHYPDYIVKETLLNDKIVSIQTCSSELFLDFFSKIDSEKLNNLNIKDGVLCKNPEDGKMYVKLWVDDLKRYSDPVKFRKYYQKWIDEKYRWEGPRTEWALLSETFKSVSNNDITRIQIGGYKPILF